MDMIKSVTGSVLRSYAILFFSQNRTFGLLLLLASLVNPASGGAGLACVLISLVMTKLLCFQRESRIMGIYSFNPLLYGLGLGSFYAINSAFIIWLITGAILVTIISVNLADFLGKYNLPLLSIPFVAGFWVLLLAAGSIYHMGLRQENSAVLYEVFAATKQIVVKFPFAGCCITIPHYIALFFSALSAVIFQNSTLAGFLIAAGILIHSRILFSVTILSFVFACLLNYWTGVYPEGISYYNLGANVIMTSAAAGCFFFVPSSRSYLWAVLIIPVVFLTINGFEKLTGYFDLPVLSAPFCALALLFIGFIRKRQQPGKLQLTLLQLYSPEQNLYQYLNGRGRLPELRYMKLNLPFMGKWTVSQGYNGSITHKGGWSQALDFVIEDNDHKTYQLPGTEPKHFYCYNKPVLACADGIVTDVISHVEDNAIGKINTDENWGNSIVIKHAEGLYSQVSHLKKDSARVKPGNFVKQGDIIGACGNSGRSPEPHLHFQVQTLPDAGSQTIAYPFSYYLDDNNQLCNFEVPVQNRVISPLATVSSVKQAFNLQPGYRATLSVAGKDTEAIEVHADAWNQLYVLSKQTGATAYFINDGTAFYFTGYYGSKKSLLFFFYLAAYKTVFTANRGIKVSDVYPLQAAVNKPILWLYDFIAPFKQLIKLSFESRYVAGSDGSDITYQTAQIAEQAGRTKQTMSALLHIGHNTIKSFSVNFNGQQIDVTWISESLS